MKKYVNALIIVAALVSTGCVAAPVTVDPEVNAPEILPEIIYERPSEIADDAVESEEASTPGNFEFSDEVLAIIEGNLERRMENLINALGEIPEAAQHITSLEAFLAHNHAQLRSLHDAGFNFSTAEMAQLTVNDLLRVNALLNEILASGGREAAAIQALIDSNFGVAFETQLPEDVHILAGSIANRLSWYTSVGYQQSAFNFDELGHHSGIDQNVNNLHVELHGSGLSQNSSFEVQILEINHVQQENDHNVVANGTALINGSLYGISFSDQNGQIVPIHISPIL